ncbi:response regulator transcription factor [Flammeovirga yaeyamensis]|nr:helix-turn-helix transcriptional regulator [Flammeovirga yaeyamensis]MBB3699507.1 DNA-binding CsgD family transcriptional regulator/NADH:ubiquinone oxidoreductase subunit 2 (subunit N) [Flammeovirga yaeyamensis]
MENQETIGLTISLLLLLISISISPMFPEKETTTFTTLLCMVLVACTTFLDTLSQQKHTLPVKYLKMHVGISILLSVFVIVSKVLGNMLFAQWPVVIFLIVSIVVSMLIQRQSKPIQQFQHLEKSNKIFALVFLTLTPIYLIFHYAFEEQYQQFQIGFLMYIAFSALAIRKIYDDLQRLSLIKNDVEPNTQQFKNYALTEREKEIATLLHKGVTYQNIADQLFISLPTVKTHASNIYKKCGVKTRNELSNLLR